LLGKWLNRRSQRHSFTWESFLRYDARHPLPRPCHLVQRNPVWGKTAGSTQSRVGKDRMKRLVR
jgi:hypothetical protein